jgi:hypothetical protein
VSEEEYRPTNRQRISGLEGRINAQQQSIRRLFDDLNALKATALEHGQRFYRYGELEAQLITRMDALENPQQPLTDDPDKQDDFPCCSKTESEAWTWEKLKARSEQIGSPMYIMGSAYVKRAILKWCPYVGDQSTTVEFRETGYMVCLACGANH